MWSAIYKNDTVFNQFNEDNSENLFKDINQEELKKFIIRTNGWEAIVNLETGECKVNGIKIAFGYDSNEHRLIYFRRVRQTLGNGAEPTITEHVGWQSTIQGGDSLKNVKRIIGMEKDRITIQCD